jgi:hypothetical protein
VRVLPSPGGKREGDAPYLEIGVSDVDLNDEGDDGERDACEECGESFNATESGSATHCVRCAPDEDDDDE